MEDKRYIMTDAWPEGYRGAKSSPLLILINAYRFEFWFINSEKIKFDFPPYYVETSPHLFKLVD